MSLPIKYNIKLATKVKTLKRRSDKRKRIQNPVAIIKYDRSAKFSEQIAIHFPSNAEVSHHEIPKERNPDLISLYFQNLKVTWRKDLKKGAIFDKNGIFSATFEKDDLKQLYSKIGHLLKEIE